MNIQEIESKLATLPNEIYEQEKKVVDSEKEYRLAELEFNVAFAKALLSADKNNATEKKNFAIVFTEERKQALIESEWLKEKEVIYAKALNDQFVAVRKLSSMEIERIRSQIN